VKRHKKPPVGRRLVFAGLRLGRRNARRALHLGAANDVGLVWDDLRADIHDTGARGGDCGGSLDRPKSALRGAKSTRTSSRIVAGHVNQREVIATPYGSLP
jgi:hypothetical protein